MSQINTERLQLIPLSTKQLELYLEKPEQLEQELGMSISRAVVTEKAQRAIRIKLAKMANVDTTHHPWYTYWLLVIRHLPFGAGLIGFKGLPDEQGEAEIGYGIDPDQQGHGYVTEAVQAMLAWAFQEPACRAVIAPDTKKWNVASNRILAKVGMHMYAETEEANFWRIEREVFEQSHVK